MKTYKSRGKGCNKSRRKGHNKGCNKSRRKGRKHVGGGLFGDSNTKSSTINSYLEAMKELRGPHRKNSHRDTATELVTQMQLNPKYLKKVKKRIEQKTNLGEEVPYDLTYLENLLSEKNRTKFGSLQEEKYNPPVSNENRKKEENEYIIKKKSWDVAAIRKKNLANAETKRRNAMTKNKRNEENAEKRNKEEENARRRISKQIRAADAIYGNTKPRITVGPYDKFLR